MEITKFILEFIFSSFWHWLGTIILLFILVHYRIGLVVVRK